MNETAPAKRLRERLPLAPQIETNFRWRGNEVSRVEGFTDAVFAFAVTLLVVALEVPHTYQGLLNVMGNFPAFVICFAILMTFWNAHYRYHRRYGFEDPFSRVITMAILVLVLFFVYPLKFLFTAITVNIFGLAVTNAPHVDTVEQGVTLYLIYGLGFAGVWGLYAVLYVHALRQREALQLTEIEVMMTKAVLAENLIYVGVCALSIAIAVLTRNTWLPGVIYFILGPLQGFNGWRFGRKVHALTGSGAG